MSINMVANHAIWPKENDKIFGLASKATEAKKKYGKDNVIDSTLGALADDDGNLICFDSVYNELKSLPNAEIAAYAQVAGQPDYLNAVVDACFKDYKPDAYIKAVATPGGTGAVKHAIFNYTNEGDSILISDWFWAPYVTISEECNRLVDTFQLFDENNCFNIGSFKEKFELLLSKQQRLVTVINSPANNPTGYSLSDEEWDMVIDIAKKNAENKENKIVLCIDVAYIDYAGDEFERRQFFKKFSNLPENIFVIVAYSMSKGYTMYGMRCGAAIGISSNEEIAEEFYYSCMHSNRANWSNGTRSAMSIMSNLSKDELKRKEYEKELKNTKSMLRKRATAFVESSKKVNLEILPYRDGFFVSIPCEHGPEISDYLTTKNMFVVGSKKGLRFAVCAVSEEKCKISPAIIKEAIDKFTNQ